MRKKIGGSSGEVWWLAIQYMTWNNRLVEDNGVRGSFVHIYLRPWATGE